MINYRDVFNKLEASAPKEKVAQAITSSRGASNPAPLRRIPGTAEKTPKLKLKPELPKLTSLKSLRKRPSEQLIKPESVKAFSFTKPRYLFGKQAFLDVEETADAGTRNLSITKRYSSSKDDPRNRVTRNFTTKTFDRQVVNVDAAGLPARDPQNQPTPEMTARFIEDSDPPKATSQPGKSEKRNNSAKKKGSKVINKDRIKVNILEDKIFQKENMLTDWLQNSKVMKKL